MKVETLSYLCESIHNLSNIPIFPFNKETGEMINLDFFRDSFNMSFLFEEKYSYKYQGNNLFNNNKEVSYYISDDNIAFGCVNDLRSNYKLYIGPCSLADITEATMKNVTQRANSPFKNNPNEHYDALHRYLLSLPRIDFSMFLNILSYTNNAVNENILTPDQFTIIEGSNTIEYSEDKNNVNIEKYDVFNEKAIDFLNNVLALIKTGDVKKLESYWDNIDVSKEIVLNFFSLSNSYDQLRKSKIQFIKLSTLVSHSASEVGVPFSVCNEMLESFIRQSESQLSLLQFEPLVRKMIVSFGQTVNKFKKENIDDNLIAKKAINYINDHINEKITTSLIAQRLRISRSYLSVSFSRSVNQTIPEYIAGKKIDYALILLKDTNMSLIEISDYLSFSSQSYFQNIFKKMKGCTPLQYRNNDVKNQ